MNHTYTHTKTHIRAKQQLDSNWWLDSSALWDAARSIAAIEWLNQETCKNLLSVDKLCLHFRCWQLCRALMTNFQHIDKLCLHSQIMQTNSVDKLCRQTRLILSFATESVATASGPKMQALECCRVRPRSNQNDQMTLAAETAGHAFAPESFRTSRQCLSCI